MATKPEIVTERTAREAELLAALKAVVAEHGVWEIYKTDRRKRVQRTLVSRHEVVTASMEMARAAIAKAEDA